MRGTGRRAKAGSGGMAPVWGRVSLTPLPAIDRVRYRGCVAQSFEVTSSSDHGLQNCPLGRVWHSRIRPEFGLKVRTGKRMSKNYKAGPSKLAIPNSAGFRFGRWKLNANLCIWYKIIRKDLGMIVPAVYTQSLDWCNGWRFGIMSALL